MAVKQRETELKKKIEEQEEEEEVKKLWSEYNILFVI